MLIRCLLTLGLVALGAAAFAQEPNDAGGARNAVADRAALEKKFSDQMANSVLVGYFTIDGQTKELKEERYEIDSATKLNGDLWTITARIKYGKNDVKVPVPVKVLWAGDTPMISLTDLTIPGLGTFTSRVLFYGDRYAGTWQHGEVGGHMFGKIEKAEAEEKDPQ